MTIEELKCLKESEDKVEFKEAKHNFSWAGSNHTDQTERRKCFLGYVVALANEGGGRLIMGMNDDTSHEVVGSDFADGKIGNIIDETYARLGIRVAIDELWEGDKRVLVISIPSRPVGKTLKFEGVALMRIGDSLRNMSDDEMFAILSERDPDFSAKICDGLTIDDLEISAIEKMKLSYSNKQKNEAFLQIDNEQMLSDLKLLIDGKLTYAALILLGKVTSLDKYLPQSKIIWEYRNTEEQIHHDRREVINKPLFEGIDDIWNLINQPTLNLKHPIQFGVYIWDIFDYNEAVVREACLNSAAHRNYTMTSEIVVKQYPQRIDIINPGGFPKGVTVENILSISSTPRNRLITEILEKTGLVERSGQGVDKIFSVTLFEGKKCPDYSDSDTYQIVLRIKTPIEDRAFHIFINEYQTKNTKILGAEQIITLSKVRDGNFADLKSGIIDQLIQNGLIKKVYKSSSKYSLSDVYYAVANSNSKIQERYTIKDIEIILLSLQGTKKKVGEIEQDLSQSLNRNQIKYLLTKLQEDGVVQTQGKVKGTQYFITDELNQLRGMGLVGAVLDTLKKKHQ